MSYTPPNTNGQTTSANSSPVVIASDQSAVPANSGFLNLTQTSVAVANGDLIPQTDVSLYMWASLHVTGTFSGTYTFQGTNELTPTNWVSIPALQRATGQPASTTTGGASNAIWDIPTPFRWLRVRMTTYSSGTAVGNAYLSGQNNQMMSTTAFVTQSGTWTAIPSPSTASGGLLSFNNAALTALTVVKSSTARVHRIFIQNPNTSAAWVQFFNSSTTGGITLGTTVPLYPVYIPASGYFEDYFNFSDGFTNGCTIAATTTAYGSTAVTTGLVVSLGYI